MTFITILNKISIFLNKNKQFLVFMCLVLSLMCFYSGWYIFSVYLLVGASFLYIGLDKFEFPKQDLINEHQQIDDESLPNSFELKYYHIIFGIITLTIAFFFNILIGGFYLLFIIFGFMGAFLKWNIYNIFPQRLYIYSKNLRKDAKTVSYHWSNQFFFFKILNRISLISLPLGMIVLAFALPFHKENDPVLLLNLYHAGSLFCTHVIVSFLIDTYIIFYANVSVVYKFSYFCYRCALYSTGIMGVGFMTEEQLIHNSFDRVDFRWKPTLFTNIPRILTGKPMFLDNNQYWHAHIIQKYLPHITYEQYTSKYNNIVSQIDSTKTNEIMVKNWGSLSKNCTKQELYRIRYGENYFTSAATRR